MSDEPRDPLVSEEDDAAEARRGLIAPTMLDALASQLVWRIGRSSDDAPITIRVGLPSAASAFADLPRLRTATEAELRDALDTGEVRVEWISPKGRTA